MYKPAVTLAVALLVQTHASFAAEAEEDNSRIASCRLIVDGSEYISGRCRFRPMGNDGSFQIMGGNGKYFAQVHVSVPGSGTGYWNQEAYANHAHSDLGDLTREGACWTNERASVCAW